MKRISQKWLAAGVAALVFGVGGYVLAQGDGNAFQKVAAQYRDKAGDADFAEGVVASTMANKDASLESYAIMQNQKIIEQNEVLIKQNDEQIALLKSIKNK